MIKMKKISKKDFMNSITFEIDNKDIGSGKPDLKFVEELTENTFFMELYRRLGNE